MSKYCRCWDDPNPTAGAKCRLCGRETPRPVGHHCHARGCATSIKPELLMCAKHWRMVPPRIQKLVWASYRSGQCDDKRPSRAWLNAADAAIGVVSLFESMTMSKAEARALVDLGFEHHIVAVWSRRGPKYKKACEEVIASLKAERN